MANTFEPGFISKSGAARLNEMARRLEKLERMFLPQSSELPTFEEFDAKVTAVSSGQYTWIEQWYTSTGSFEDKAGARFGSPTDRPAYEMNGATISSFPVYVVMRRRVVVNGTPVYEFSQPATTTSGSLTVKGSDGTPSYADTTSLELDESDGFVITQPGANRVKVEITDASATTVGIITTGTQVIAGAKEFQAKVGLDNGYVIYPASAPVTRRFDSAFVTTSSPPDGLIRNFFHNGTVSGGSHWFLPNGGDDWDFTEDLDTWLVTGNIFAVTGYSVSDGIDGLWSNRLDGATGTIDLTKVATVVGGIITNIA